MRIFLQAENEAQVGNMAVAHPAADEALDHTPVPSALMKRQRIVQVKAEQLTPEQGLSEIDSPKTRDRVVQNQATFV